ncbi:predicted protein [Naegleria gruberi]|uniref:Predicted protein n=1 Tax=Naegleria gruberi TaxID=5762 RepID=D2W3T2_NAEGR|nr:uncharacterized protein NAEGRDRAFT_76057 [Naegleria gruberi]EFC36318.1 predicted protein [Naegleria gruberi]|eukprot:XP_002669062.1 predicted protein [Naegleria gruberi strain NEG-M]
MAPKYDNSKLAQLVESNKLKCQFTNRPLISEDKVSADHMEVNVNGHKVAYFRSFCSFKMNLLIGRIEMIFRKKGNDKNETLSYFRTVLDCIRSPRDLEQEEIACKITISSTHFEDGKYYSRKDVQKMIKEHSK